ncbi:hypothetical protein B9Z55_016621 [Caenorhabditis nigoni]|uniref:C-type lectin domain-containing protein n=1 Tax=Caenorhabditis nigoni TaxID=1611254 RepID=A0A2G5T5X3_9PELO|nr:hypothetical protein B9Z55_016621 [Caenorhabditis nigoni]
MIKTAVILFSAVVVANAMMRPIRIQNYEDCSCEHHETEPCDEEEEPSTPPKTVPTTPSTTQKTTTKSSTSTTVTSTTTQTTSPPTTTSPTGCPTTQRYTPFKRKNGWWCGSMIQVSSSINVPMPYRDAEELCLPAKFASLETEEELEFFTRVARNSRFPITGFWAASAYNATSERWYWSDGQADPNIEKQPTVRDTNGRIAVLVGSDPDPAILEVVPQSGRGSVTISTAVCGVPGLQFS